VSEGQKRAADGESAVAKRATKASKTKDSTSPGKTSPKGGKKVCCSHVQIKFKLKSLLKALPLSAFKSRALPLHANVTHTPPSITDDKGAPAANVDPGFIGNTTLVPTTFSTGSYGWKGTKRITVELENSESGKEKEKVQVMLTCVLFLFCVVFYV
jgi:hypothetical protein